MFSPQKMSVLYVEYDADVQKTVAASIRDEGYKVYTADTTIKAYDLFNTHKIDIIIITCQSNHNNGLEFIRHLREKNLTIPVIITTSSLSEQLLLEAINLDIVRCIVKPYESKELIDALEVASNKVLLCHPISPTDLKHGFLYHPVNKIISSHDSKSIHLSKKESLFIELLLHNKGQIVPYSVIERTVWEDRPMSMDALRTLVGSIRKKTHPDIVSNHNGIGYKIDY